MMRLIGTTAFTFLFMASVSAQQNAVDTPAAARQTNQPVAQPVAQAQAVGAAGTKQEAINQVAANQPADAAAMRPFPVLTPAQDARLQAILNAWQTVSSGTKTLECEFDRWEFDLIKAPAGIHWSKATGVVKYAAPDKGLFRVDNLMFYKGMQAGKPQYAPEANMFGEHWVCNGRELIDFDRSKRVCEILAIPAEMQGKEIFNSPLPFVFNLDATKIQQRYWIRERKAPKESIYLLEAFPKQQADRAQYKMVQIALDQNTFLPQALIMYAPNFNIKLAPKWNHYEFKNMKVNKVGNGIQNFFKNFIPEKPPANWQITRGQFMGPVQQAKAAGPAKR